MIGIDSVKISNMKINIKENRSIVDNIHSHELEKKRFLKINSVHIEHVIECVSSNKTKIGNIKQYLLAAIFNATNTIGSYYTTEVKRNLYE